MMATGPLRCKTCGETITHALREHLATHHDGAWAFSSDEVRDCFETAKRKRGGG
jgi:DNA-directed RNA polymerase subunit N (RpoN/RPB10)